MFAMTSAEQRHGVVRVVQLRRAEEREQPELSPVAECLEC
jgi:hypothetical protein